MDKYIPAKIEPKWQKVWEKHKLYQAVDFDKKRPKKYLLVEFPYPSGEGLHIGHAFTNTILDVLARKKRMEGNNVLYPMGWDAFGLPTENYAIKSGVHPTVVTKRNTKRFRDQDKRLAFAYNWDREINTTDPAYYKWTQWIFIQLFKHGLAYKAERPVGWCPACKIVLANEEIVGGKCERCGAEAERRQQAQWLLRITAYADRLADELDLVDYPDYVKAAQRNWIGRSEGAEIKFPLFSPKSPKSPDSITVFTTRADTLFGTTAIVLAPEHVLIQSLLLSSGSSGSSGSPVRAVRRYVETSRQKSELERTELTKEKTGVFTGLYCQNPINGEKIPVWVGDYVIGWYGGGAVMVVPAHDQRDFEFAKKYHLPVKTVISPKSPKSPKLSEAFEDDGVLINSGQFSGLSSVQARKRITTWLTKRNLGRKMISYHLRDWIFSRQHYWGEPIPMIFCPACAKKGIIWWDTGGEDTSGVAGWFPLPEKDLPLELPKVEKYQPTDTGESPLANVKSWVKVACPECRGTARRETDTMPNWAGSSWYYLAYCFSHKLGNQKSKIKNQKNKTNKENVFMKYKRLLNYWMPVDLYLGGGEHTTLHLLYSRFWHKFLNDIGVVPGKEPYAARRQHGDILAEDGFRMSKSRGNVINPEEVVNEYGADTLRIYLMFMGPYEDTMPWNTKGVQGCYRFLSRVWRLVLSSMGSLNPCPEPAEGLPSGPSSPSLLSLLHRTIQKVSKDIDSLKYNTAIAAMMEFVNEWQRRRAMPCASKSKGSSALPCPPKPAASGAGRRESALSFQDIQKFLLLLAPFAPHITEELWSRLSLPSNPSGPPGSSDFSFSSIHLQPWPSYDPKLIRQKKVTVVVQVNGKLRDRLTVSPKEARDKDKIVALALASPKIQKYFPKPACRQARLPKTPKFPKFIFVPGKLVNFVASK